MRPPLRQYAYALAFLVLATYAYMTLRGPRGLHALFEKRAQIQQMEKSNVDLKQENARKRDRNQRLENNASAQEMAVRERLKLAHPKEKVFVFADPGKKK